MIGIILEKDETINRIEKVLSDILEYNESHIEQTEYQFHQIVNGEKNIKEMILDIKR